MKPEEILSNINKILEEEGYLTNEKKSNSELLGDFILPGLKNSKDILNSIYSFQARNRSGFVGKIKNAMQNKIVNTCINVIEKQSMKQQKFNELTYRAIEALVEENRELRSSIEKKS